METSASIFGTNTGNVQNEQDLTQTTLQRSNSLNSPGTVVLTRTLSGSKLPAGQGNDAALLVQKNFLAEQRIEPKQNALLKAMGFYNRADSNKFAYIITAIIVSALAIAIGLTVHYVGADNILHWFQGDFTSFFKHTLVNWITDNSMPLRYTAITVGGLALGILMAHLKPKIKEKAFAALEAFKALRKHEEGLRIEDSSDSEVQKGHTSEEENFVGGQ